MFDYEFSKTSLKQFKRLSKDIQQKIVKKLDYFCSQEDPLYFAEPLTNTKLGKYRFRVGDFRITFDLEDLMLVIHDVGNRKDIYRK